MFIAVPVDGFAGYQFHDDVGQAGPGGAAIEQARDVAMIEGRQYLAFGLEALLGERAPHVGAHQLDGHFGLVLIVGTHCAEHIAHAARAQHAHHAIRADTLADVTVVRRAERFVAQALGHGVEVFARLLV